MKRMKTSPAAPLGSRNACKSLYSYTLDKRAVTVRRSITYRPQAITSNNTPRKKVLQTDALPMVRAMPSVLCEVPKSFLLASHNQRHAALSRVWKVRKWKRTNG
jgi:hypothetical protein